MTPTISVLMALNALLIGVNGPGVPNHVKLQAYNVAQAYLDTLVVEQPKQVLPIKAFGASVATTTEATTSPLCIVTKNHACGY